MATPVCEVFLTENPIGSPPRQPCDEVGAVVDFWGVVRATENERVIAGIDYEAHPRMAEHQLRVVAQEALARFSVERTAVFHRIGFVPVREASLLVRVEAGHRAEGLNACRWIVDELKVRVPIWKHPRATSPKGSALLG